MGFFSKEETKKIKARLIVEIIGKPKEHILETMKLVVQKMKEDDRWSVIKESISEPEDREELFSIFCSCEIEFKNMNDILAYCFDYLPASIEIEEPTEFNLSVNTMTSFVNDFIGRLHQTDMVAKRVRADNEVLQRNTTQLFRNFLTFAIKSGKRTDEELSKVCGIPVQDVPKFIDPFISEGWVERDNEGYKVK